MNTGKDIEIAEAMSDAIEGGAAIAWRLLATLEGGSLLLAASALLAYTARGRAARTRQPTLPCASVAITNTTCELGRALKRCLEGRGCAVSAITSEATTGADTGNKYDALIIVGAEPKADGLDGLSGLISEDIYNNIKLLEGLSAHVNPGGYIAWACARAERSLGAFGSSATAFDTVLQASLMLVANVYHCVPIWVGRCDGAERTAERVVTALMTSNAEQDTSNRFSIRNALHTVGEYLYRLLKITT